MSRKPCEAPDGQVYSPEEMDAWNIEQEARKKRAFEMKWHHLADLPGFEEWLAQYQGLDRIIPHCRQHRILVHPDEFGRPFDETFVRVFQGQLDDTSDYLAAYKMTPLLPTNLERYKKGLSGIYFRGAVGVLKKLWNSQNSSCRPPKAP